jgi:hypothetical protein
MIKTMKTVNTFLIAVVIATTASLSFSSCKKGDDDPVVSLKSRKDRFTNTWTLTKYEKNGTTQDLSGTTYIYNVYNAGTLTQTVEGSIFGFPTRTTSDGTWNFINDDEDVEITIGSQPAIIYNIQRLASKELWLKRNIGSDSYIYYYEVK